MTMTHSDQFFLIDISRGKAPDGSYLSVHSFADTRTGGRNTDFRTGLIDGTAAKTEADMPDPAGLAYSGDSVTIRTRAGHTVTYTGDSIYLADGRLIFTPTDGQRLQDGVLLNSHY